MSCRFLCVKMRKYGVPYKGSKSKLAEWIVNILPPENTLVDLFAGGCAVTHAAIVSGKWKNVVCNDKDPRGIRLFIDSIHGKYTVKNCPEWVSREEFEEKKRRGPIYCDLLELREQHARLSVRKKRRGLQTQSLGSMPRTNGT